MKLEPITKNNWEQVAKLTTNSDGIPTLEEQFVCSNAYSMLQAQFEEGWQTRVITVDGQPVGFCMFGENREDHIYEICRLMIDFRFQHRGYGSKALQLLLQEIPEAPIYISAEPENTVAIRLYEHMGFCNTGKLLDGEVLLVMEQNSYRKDNL